MAGGTIRIGTSGWHYPHWVGPFYPEGTRPDAFLDHYARTFDAVEINATFYRLPDPAVLAAWRDRTPGRFVFACKASRYITHMKKLRDPEGATARFFDTITVLGEKLGPVLFQLPPRWRADPERLATFLEALPQGFRYAFEFRDATWFTPEIYRLLRRHDVALCAYDLGGRRSPVEATANFLYVRLHGPDGPYRGRYDGRTLSGWARRFRAWADDGRDVYCFFDNDEAGFAAADGGRLGEMVDRRRGQRGTA